MAVGKGEVCFPRPIRGLKLHTVVKLGRFTKPEPKKASIPVEPKVKSVFPV